MPLDAITKTLAKINKMKNSFESELRTIVEVEGLENHSKFINEFSKYDLDDMIAILKEIIDNNKSLINQNIEFLAKEIDEVSFDDEFEGELVLINAEIEKFVNELLSKIRRR